MIGDVKRGDIGSTSSAYAVGHLGKVKVGSNVCSGFDTDFITVNPYLGTDGVKPFVDVCQEEDSGLFVLVKTSNPSSGEFQDRLIDGRPLYELVAEKVVEWGADMHGRYIQQCGSRCGSHLSGDEQDLKKANAEYLLPGAGLRRPGRYSKGSGATASMKTGSARWSTPPAASSRLTSRKNTPSSARSISQRRPDRQLWT